MIIWQTIRKDKCILFSFNINPNNEMNAYMVYYLRFAGAANKLEAAGFQNISCITSGLQSVQPGWLDVVGSKELQDACKAGLVQVQGKISAVLGTVLICAYLFITFFPDQADKMLALLPSS